MANLTIRDAFKALEDVEDIIEVKPVAKQRKKVAVNESVEKKPLVEEPVYDLRPEFDSRKSFYGKARVDEKPNGSKILWSYFTPVCFISKDGDVKLLRKGYYSWASSPTTLRHVKDFLQQNGKEVGSKNELANKYPTVDYYELGESLRESGYFTDKAKEQIAKAKEIGLIDFYDPYIGNFTFNLKDYEANKDKIDKWADENDYYGVISQPASMYDGDDYLASSEDGNAYFLTDIWDDGYEDDKFQHIIRMPKHKYEESCGLKEGMTINLNDEEEVKKGKEELEKSEEKEDSVEQIVDVDAETIDELKDSYIGNVILQCPVCRTLIYKKPEAIEKDENDENIYNVEEECPHCGAKDGFELVGQVASLDVEPDKPIETTGAPSEEEVKEEENSEENVRVEKEPKEEEEEIKVDEITLESLDEERFDKLINKYVHNIYENVDSYRTVSGSLDDENNKIVVEGKIKYNSGKEIDTKFVFEAVAKASNGKIKLKGLNETFTKAKKPFTMIADVKKNTLRCESLKYNYNVKVLNESKKVKGQVLVRDKKPIK